MEMSLQADAAADKLPAAYRRKLWCLGAGAVLLERLPWRRAGTAPAGRALTRAEAPHLFKTLAELRRKLKGPAIAQVLVNEEFDAAIVAVAPRAPWSRPRHVLVLGLAYLLGVPARELLARVAHEYGHLCRPDDPLGAWIYRQRRSLAALQAHGDAGPLLRRYLPYYNAATFAMARHQHNAADRSASSMVGPASHAASLVRQALLGRWIAEQFWPRLHRQADSAAAPHFLPFGALRSAIKAGHAEWAAPARLAAAWLRQAAPDQVAPALRQRVEAIGVAAVAPAPSAVTAAEILLGRATLHVLIAEFDQAWWAREQAGWAARYHAATLARARLRSLLASPLRTLALAELQELALLSAQFARAALAKPVLQHLLAQPGGPFPRAALAYGAMLLEDGDRAGLAHLATAAAHDASLAGQVADLGFYFLLQHDGAASAGQWWHDIAQQQHAA